MKYIIMVVVLAVIGGGVYAAVRVPKADAPSQKIEIENVDSSPAPAVVVTSTTTTVSTTTIGGPVVSDCNVIYIDENGNAAEKPGPCY